MGISWCGKGDHSKKKEAVSSGETFGSITNFDPSDRSDLTDPTDLFQQ